MLVKVNERYKGVYGHYDRAQNTVKAKRAGDPPFYIADEDARRHIKNGVLVEVVKIGRTDKPAVPEKTVKVITQEPVKPEKAIEDMTFPELKAAAKERGINIVGKKKAAVIKLIKEYDAENPVLMAEMPV